MTTRLRRLAAELGFAHRDADPNAATLRQVDVFFEQLERTPFDTLRLFVVRPAAPAEINGARRRAQAAADAGGRMDLRLEAAAAIDGFLGRAFDSHAYDPTKIGIAWRHEPLQPEDRVRLRNTLIDASLAVVAQDLIDDRTFDQLVGPCSQLVR